MKSNKYSIKTFETVNFTLKVNRGISNNGNVISRQHKMTSGSAKMLIPHALYNV